MGRIGPGDWAYVDGEGQSFVPDRKITYDAPTYIYRPMRGYGYSVAVIDIHDNIIGWMPIEVLGFDTVREWMDATGYAVRDDLRGDEGFQTLHTKRFTDAGHSYRARLVVEEVPRANWSEYYVGGERIPHPRGYMEYGGWVHIDALVDGQWEPDIWEGEDNYGFLRADASGIIAEAIAAFKAEMGQPDDYW